MSCKREVRLRSCSRHKPFTMSYNDALLCLSSLLSITLHLYESKRPGSRIQSQVFAPAVLLEPAAVNACFACLAPLSLPLLLCCALLCSAAVDGPHVALATRLSGGDLSISRSFCHPSLPFLAVPFASPLPFLRRFG